MSCIDLVNSKELAVYQDVALHLIALPKSLLSSQFSVPQDSCKLEQGTQGTRVGNQEFFRNDQAAQAGLSLHNFLQTVTS